MPEFLWCRDDRNRRQTVRHRCSTALERRCGLADFMLERPQGLFPLVNAVGIVGPMMRDQPRCLDEVLTDLASAASCAAA